MDKQFEKRVEELFFDGERTELHQLIMDQREALETIAYPANHPETGQIDSPFEQVVYVKNWMASVAANALTNAGR